MAELELVRSPSASSHAYNPFDVTPQNEHSTLELIEEERKVLLQVT